MRSAIAIYLALVAAPAPAAASPCADDGLPDGPVQLRFEDGTFSRPARACPRTEVSFEGGGLLVADFDDFYGNVRAAGLLSGRWAVTPDLELLGALEVLRYQTVISSVSAEHFGVGHLSIGASYRLVDASEIAIAVFGRITSPVPGLYSNAVPIDADTGIGAVYRISESFQAQWAFGVLGSLQVSEGPTYPRGGVTIDAGFVWQPASWFAIAVDAAAQAFYADALDHLAIASALRFGIAGSTGFEVAATVPVIGRERSVLAAALRINHRFE